MSSHEALHCLQDTVFYVYHHFAIPQGTAVNCSVEIRTVSLGIYSSFFAAQAAAVRALDLNLKRLQSAGFTGKYCNDIDLRKRGLITQITKNGYERPLSEYVIQAMPIPDRAVHGGSSLGVPGQRTGVPKPSFSPPPKRMPPTMSEIEHNPLWAQSRTPYFRKRDEGPFRSVDEPAYATSFVINMPEERKQAANGVTVNKSNNKRAVGKLPQKAMIPDHDLETQTKPECIDAPDSKVTEKERADGEKLSGTGSARKQSGGGKDIGPVYRGRRHSTSLD